MAISALLCAMLLRVSDLRAQDATEDAARDVFNTVMSPFCPGRLLNDCPSASAGELKNKIRSELRSGKSKAQVLEEVYGTFGSELRAAPENKGFGTLAWWTPVAFVLAGAIVIGLWLKRSQSKKEAAEAGAPAPVTPEMQRRIDEELRRFDS